MSREGKWVGCQKSLVQKIMSKVLSMKRHSSVYERNQMIIFRMWAWDLVMPILENRTHAVRNNESTRASERKGTFLKENRQQDIHLPALLHDDSFLGVTSYATIVEERSKYFTHKPKKRNTPRKRRRVIAEKLCTQTHP